MDYIVCVVLDDFFYEPCTQKIDKHKWLTLKGMTVQMYYGQIIATHVRLNTILLAYVDI